MHTWLLVDLDEDALPWTLIRRFDDLLEATVGDASHAGNASWVGHSVEQLLRPEGRRRLLHVEQTVVEGKEDLGRELFAQAVTGAEILVNPNLHVVSFGW